MNTESLPNRIRLAFPFTVLTKPGIVRLIAGEDFRYTLRAPTLDQWLPLFLKNFESEAEWRPAFRQLPEEHHQPARQILTRLYGERILLDGNEQPLPLPAAQSWQVEGIGPLSDRLRSAAPAVASAASRLAVLCQDKLDYAGVLDFNLCCLRSNVTGWIWISSGAMGRGFVSPIIRRHSGPCLNCLLRNFKRLSPNPEIYDHLMEHAASGGEIAPTPFPASALDLLANLSKWKIESSTQADPPSAVYRLHVLEIDKMDCTTHDVLRDPHCPDCSVI